MMQSLLFLALFVVLYSLISASNCGDSCNVNTPASSYDADATAFVQYVTFHKSKDSTTRRDQETALPNVAMTEPHDDKALFVDEKLVLPLAPDGHFILGEGIRRVFLDVGIYDKTDFEKEILEDSSLLVIGIEANPEMLKKQKFEHPRFKLFNFAAGKQDGQTVFHVTNHPACSSVKQPAGDSFDKFGTGELTQHWPGVGIACVRVSHNVTVPMRRLETFLRRIPSSISIDYLKTDVQGYDFEVLKSAGPELDRVHKVQYEIQNVTRDSGLYLYEGVTPFSEVTNFIASQGFRPPVCSTINTSVTNALKEYDCTSCRIGKEYDGPGCFSRQH